MVSCLIQPSLNDPRIFLTAGCHFDWINIGFFFQDGIVLNSENLGKRKSIKIQIYPLFP
jgi:hypothetical protein